ncbi:MAG: hypothetical protein ACYDBJ_22695 [Aggregatilineales bacterium]
MNRGIGKRTTQTEQVVTGKRATQNQITVAGPAITEFPVTLFAANFQARGMVRSPGVLQTFLNDEQRSTLVVYNADVIGFEPTNPAARVSVPELIVRKVSCQIVAFDRRPPPDQYTLLPHTEPAAIYTDQFIVEGNFHMGADARLTDFADTSLQQFIVASDARIYPLFQPRAALVPGAPLIAVHKSAIRFYHATPSGM